MIGLENPTRHARTIVLNGRSCRRISRVHPGGSKLISARSIVLGVRAPASMQGMTDPYLLMYYALLSETPSLLDAD